ncbi:MAG: hypothetical protein IJ830_02545 [Alphaproteobacteria bacterium]|nr:hypothetical protein [Alphaproteobacteria bacterium]
MRNNENGRSMVEMLGVLAIIGVLSAGGLAGYSKAMFKHKLNTTMEQVTMLVTNIRTAYGSQRLYTDLDLAKARQLGAVPASIGADGKNPFKGSIVIGTSKARATAADATAFMVTYGGLPKEACIALATADFGSGAGSGFVGVAAFPAASSKQTVNNKEEDVANTADALYVGAATEGKPLTMSQALESTACGSEINTVSWKFY